MSTPTQIDTLIAEQQRARDEGATWVLLQVNAGKVAYQAVPEFASHDSNFCNCYVIGGARAEWVPA